MINLNKKDCEAGMFSVLLKVIIYGLSLFFILYLDARSFDMSELKAIVKFLAFMIPVEFIYNSWSKREAFWAQVIIFIIAVLCLLLLFRTGLA